MPGAGFASRSPGGRRDRWRPGETGNSANRRYARQRRPVLREMGMDDANILFGIETARDAGLIGDNEHEQPGVIERLDRGFGALDPAEPRDRADIPVIVVEHPVAVEKAAGRRRWLGISRLARARSAGTPISMK